jgi:hypothetical protein
LGEDKLYGSRKRANHGYSTLDLNTVKAEENEEEVKMDNAGKKRKDG